MIEQNTVEKIIYMSWRREKKGIGLLPAHKFIQPLYSHYEI